MKRTITIDISYEKNSVLDEDRLEVYIQQALEKFIKDGGLEPIGFERLEDWKVEIK